MAMDWYQLHQRLGQLREKLNFVAAQLRKQTGPEIDAPEGMLNEACLLVDLIRRDIVAYSANAEREARRL